MTVERDVAFVGLVDLIAETLEGAELDLAEVVLAMAAAVQGDGDAALVVALLGGGDALDVSANANAATAMYHEVIPHVGPATALDVPLAHDLDVIVVGVGAGSAVQENAVYIARWLDERAR